MLKKLFAAITLLALVVPLVAGCATPTPEIVEKVVTEIVKETVIVEGTPQVVEKEVTKIIEVEKVVTATPEPKKEMRKGGTLVIADAESNTSLDPFITSWHSWPHYALYATLMTYDMNLDYVGVLADTWEASEDGKTLTVKLIDYATFSDGTPVNAEAIKWNFEHGSDPETGASGWADMVGLLEEFEVVDEYTFNLHLTRSYAPLYHVLSGLEIVSPTAYKEWGVDDFGTHPIGAGPFLLKELVTDNYVVLEKRPDFKWAPEELYDPTGPVYLDEFMIKFIGEEQTVLAGLETGEFHFSGIPTQNLADMEANPDVYVHSQMQNQIRYVGFNTSKAPWDNPELRRALSYAINRPEVVALAYDGQAEPLYQPLPPTIWGHNPDLDAGSYHYDPDKAMEMLDALGYKDVDGDGFREDPDGNPWPVRLSTASADEWKRLAEVVEAQFRDVGLKVEILEWSAVIDLTTTGTHDLFLLLYGYTEPSILTYFFDPARIGGSNRAWYDNKELADLLVEADSDLNRETRYETITQISQLVIDEAPWIFLCVPNMIYGIRNELKGWKIHPFGDLLYYNAYFEVEE
jgi:peptide/nickel transport system substrate-binding protein